MTTTTTDLLTTYAELFARGITADDLANSGPVGAELYDLADTWIRTQTDNADPYLRDLARKKPKGGLTDRQAAAVLNCLSRPSEPPVFHAREIWIGDTVVTARNALGSKSQDRDGDDDSYDDYLAFRTQHTPAGLYSHYTLGPWRPNSALGNGARNRRVDFHDHTIGYQRETGTLDALPSVPRPIVAAFYQVMAGGE